MGGVLIVIIEEKAAQVAAGKALIYVESSVNDCAHLILERELDALKNDGVIFNYDTALNLATNFTFNSLSNVVRHARDIDHLNRVLFYALDLVLTSSGYDKSLSYDDTMHEIIAKGYKTERDGQAVSILGYAIERFNKLINSEL
jgi:hypothetical protein